MAIEDVQAMLRKATVDDTFRLRLAKNFDKTVAEHELDLSGEEVKALKAVNWKSGLPTGRAAAAGTWVHIYKSTVQER